MVAVVMLCYASLLVLVVGLAVRIGRYARAPVHLRWELYPVPHEVGKPHGGSCYEDLDWWSRPRQTSFLGDLRVMLSEILAHAGLWHHNRRMWWVSYPFHIGIYLVAAYLLLLLAGGICQAAGVAVAPGAGGVPAAIYHLSLVAGPAGMTLAILGSLGLLGRRLADRDLRSMSAPADYFNLVFILVVSLAWLLTWALVDPSFHLARAFVQGLVSLRPPAGLPPAVLAEMVLLACFLAYLPFTHMTHFVGKWFTYHEVRWDDHPNLGTEYERAVAGFLARPVAWSAPHIKKPDSTRTWAGLVEEVE